MRGEDTPATIKGTRLDPLYAAARALVLTARRASIAMVQRHLRIGYNHATQLLEAMEGDILSAKDSNNLRSLLPPNTPATPVASG